MIRTALRQRSRTHKTSAAPPAQAPAFHLVWMLGPGLVAAGDLIALGLTMPRRSPLLGWAFVAVALLGLLIGRSYRPRGRTLVADTGGIVARLAVAASIVGAIGWSNPEAAQLLRALPLGIGAVLVARSLTYAVVRRLAARTQRPVLIAGAGRRAVEYANTLADHPEYGLRPIGFVDQPDGAELPLPLLGTVDDLHDIAREHRCRDVIVAFGRTREADILRALRLCERDQLDLWIIPRFYELGAAPAGPQTIDVWGLPLVSVASRRRRDWTKRAIDIPGSALLLALTAPLFAVLAALVKLSSPGPVFFRQRRIGQHGRPCDLLKFRTMRVHDGSDTAWTEDDHVTPLGRILRGSSADELPQLWNVLRGDMSLVGPRPERPHFADVFAAQIDGYADRTRMPVGMTGWAQVKGLRGDTSIDERVRFDNRYINHWSPFLDLAILVGTFPAVAREAFGPLLARLRTRVGGRTGRRAFRVTASVTVIALVVGIGAVALAATPPTSTTYRDSSYSAFDAPTEDKPQSKLWYQDGSWWGLQEAGSDRTVHVVELRADHTWRDTGTRVSSRNSRGDALVDGNRVYIATRTDQRIEVNRLSYVASSRRYTVDSGFPTTVTNRGVESVTIAKDSSGLLWLTFTYGNRVWVATSDTSGSRWSSAFNPPGDSTVAPDDISAIVSYDGHVGLMWSDQQSLAFRFISHRDGDRTNRWQSMETPIAGPGIAEDHMNLHSDGGRIYAVVKTSRNDAGGALTEGIVLVLVRDPNGSWHVTTAWTIGDAVTRPIALIDKTTNRLHLFATAPESGGKIYTKSAPLDALSFTSGRGSIFMETADGKLNNATSTKQAVTATTGIVVVASAHTIKRYYHAEQAIVAPDVQAPTTPAGVTATPSNATSLHLAWSPSTDNVGVQGYRVLRDGADLGAVTSPGFQDDTTAANTTYAYTVAAFDAAGNTSPASAPAVATTPDLGEAGIDFRAASSAQSADSRALDIPTPAGVAAGDVMLASIDVRGNPAVNAPAGWSLVRADQNGFALRKVTFVRVAEDPEPASHTFTFTQTQSSSGTITAYAGVDQAAPIDASDGTVSTASTSIAAPTVTTTSDGARIVGLYSTAAATTVAPPAGATERGEASSSAGLYDVTSEASDDVQATAGETGVRTAHSVLTASNIGQLVALRPA